MAYMNKEIPEIKTSRPPIVTIMGHVDHGKTSLLDALANTNVAAKEVGEITQGISAFTVNFEGKKITFIDTPGHEAFMAMRARGSQTADIVLLVVSAVEGVKPQTQESIDHIKNSSVDPILVITKMDLPEANPEKVKRQLAENGFVVEGLGGQIPVAQVSIKDKESLKKLLELILLVADLKERAGSNEGDLEAVVIESLLDRKKGPLALVVVRDGHLGLGQEVYTPTVAGKVRSLINNQGLKLNEVLVGEAGWIMGLNKAPKVGQVLHSGKSAAVLDSEPKTGGTREAKFPPASDEKIVGINLKIILKAETLGSLEAITAALAQLPQGTEGKIQIIAAGVGDINESDIYLAKTTGAIAIGFKVRILGSSLDLAKEREVEVQTYDLIYKLLEEVKLGLLGLNQWTKRKGPAQAQVKKIFTLPSGDKILGCLVVNGTFREGQNVVLMHAEVELFKTSIKNIKIAKTNVEKVTLNNECGFLLSAKDVSSVSIGDEMLAL